MNKKIKILAALMAAAMLLSMTACDNSTSISDPDSSTNVGEKLPVDHDNPRIDYTPDELAEIINKLPNIKAAENILSDAPKSLGHVSTFESCSAAQLPFEEGLANFKEALEYLSPGREFSEKCFAAIGGAEENNLPIYENYEKYKSGELKVTLFEYDESSLGIEEPIYYYARTPVCNDLSSFNRGVLQRIVKPDSKSVRFLFTGGFVRGAEYIGTFAPDSEERFKLLDKEVSVKEAAEFFENYVSEIPCSAGSSFKTKVIYVSVYKIKDDLYCFDYVISRDYDNIAFDYTVSGSNTRRPGGDMGSGSMIESNSVDSFYGVIRAFTAENETQYTDFISCEDAAKAVSENMTDYVIFEARSVRLLYCNSSNIGSSSALGEYKTNVFPMWVFELYNPNDGLTYNCYLNALNGEFKYYR